MTPKNANILISGPNRPFGLSMQLLYIDPVKNWGIVKPEDQDSTISVPENRVIGQLTLGDYCIST